MPLEGDLSMLCLANCYDLVTILCKAEENLNVAPAFRAIKYCSDISPKKVTHPTTCQDNDYISPLRHLMPQTYNKAAYFGKYQAVVGVSLLPSNTIKEQRPKVYKQVPNSLSLGFPDVNYVDSDYEHLDYLDLAMYEDKNVFLRNHHKAVRTHKNRSRRTTTRNIITGPRHKNQNAEHNPTRIPTCRFGTRRLLDHPRDDLRNQVCWYHDSWWNRRRRDLACQRPPIWSLSWVMEGYGFL